MSWLVRYLRSSVGAKHVMAVTGLLLLLFAIFHMLGHLQMFGGREMYNGYANFLQRLWEVKWPVRVGLLGLLILHVVIALALVAKNRAARPIEYAVYRPQRSSIVGRSMALSGLVVLAFLIFHIIDMTIDPAIEHNAYSLYVAAFQVPWHYAVYLVGILLLAMHLGHGASSWLQSLGWRHPKYPADRIGPLVAVGLFVGYMIPPTAVLVGVIS
ncbi:MAG TPA: succinate dehydrogenase cytochrome b subunit [Kofleriaceae bacterium]|nr:succinate dehydrogenase cytochrome b subunit [Kofleriaceae bacterium]